MRVEEIRPHRGKVIADRATVMRAEQAVDGDIGGLESDRTDASDALRVVVEIRKRDVDTFRVGTSGEMSEQCLCAPMTEGVDQDMNVEATGPHDRADGSQTPRRPRP